MGIFSSAPSRIARNKLDPTLEDQFEVLFGEQPGIGQEGRAAWEYAYRYFEGITSEPFAYSEERVESAMSTFEAFGFPRPVFFSQRGRVLARFAGMPIDINPDAAAVIVSPGATIAAMQVNKIRRGIKVDPVQFMVPGNWQKINSELP